MNQVATRDPRDEIDARAGESTNAPQILDSSALPAHLRAEIDSQIATARQYPRNMVAARERIKALATMDEETAAECLYALIRRGSAQARGGAAKREDKPIEGPSIRLAEIAAQQWGNCRIEAHVTTVNRQEKYVEAIGTFHDLETNMASTASVKRRISTRTGGLFSEDMIIVTGNAACAIAKRNAILAGVPRGVYREAYLAAREKVAGTVATLPKRRDDAIKAFAVYGVRPEQLLELLNLEDLSQIEPDHIATLRGVYFSIRNQETSVEDVFAKPEKERDPNHNPLVKTDAADGEGDAADSSHSGDATPDAAMRAFDQDLGKITGGPRELRAAAAKHVFEPNSDQAKASQRIYDIHLKRIAGELTPAECVKQVNEVLGS